jgi:hypothetical protein
MRTTKSSLSFSMSLAAAAAVALLTGACGSSHPQPSTNANAASGPKNVLADAYKFSACMRDHGVSNFPDPKVSTNGSGTQIAIHVVANAQSPQFIAAQKACRGLMPQPSPAEVAAQQRAHMAGLLSFARCLRAHGLTSFPDPNSQGQLTPEMIQASGINLHAPNVLPAAKACIPASHGVVNGAAVAHAIASAPS